MKHFSSATLIICVLAIVGLMINTGQAQVRFEVPLVVSGGAPDIDTLYFGLLPNALFGLRFGDPPSLIDSINGHQEAELPPAPPSGIFDTRLIWPRAGVSPDPPAGFGQGSSNDFRPYASATQRDTFRVKSQLGTGITMTLSWPTNLATRWVSMNLRYFDQVAGQNVNTDMLTTFSVNITDAGDPATANIYTFSPLTSVEQTSNGIPEAFALSQNYPNPFNPTTTVKFSIVQSAMTDISVYDILGRKVATLASQVMTPGFYNATWDGKNSVGSSVASGVYFVRMEARAENGVGFSAMRKLLLMK